MSMLFGEVLKSGSLNWYFEHYGDTFCVVKVRPGFFKCSGTLLERSPAHLATDRPFDKD